MIKGNAEISCSCARQLVQPVPLPALPTRLQEDREQDAPRLNPGCYRAGGKVSLKVAQVLQGSSAHLSQSSQGSLCFHASELQAKGPWLCPSSLMCSSSPEGFASRCTCLDLVQEFSPVLRDRAGWGHAGKGAYDGGWNEMSFI